MKIIINTTKGEANVDMETVNTRPAEVLVDYMTSVNALTDAYKKVVKAIDLPEEATNAISAFVNNNIKENLDENIPYEEDNLVKASLGLFNVLKMMVDDLDKETLEKIKNELMGDE